MTNLMDLTTNQKILETIMQRASTTGRGSFTFSRYDGMAAREFRLWAKEHGINILNESTAAGIEAVLIPAGQMPHELCHSASRGCRCKVGGPADCLGWVPEGC
jgi:hypothetical protein